MNPFKKDEIVILVGAGASVDAKMPDSTTMVRKVEDLIEQDKDWKQYRSLYNYIKSSIYYSEGLKGEFDKKVLFNIERLINTLEELKKKDEHTLYPFVGAWNPKLVEIGGENFQQIASLRDQIVRKLREDWIELKHVETALYYKGLEDFQREYEHPLRVFSLNYDLCIEKVCTSVTVERGFNRDRKWDWRLFEDTGTDPKSIYLYKLHGSTDWTYDGDGNLTFLDSTSAIKSEDVAIIFGTSYKLQYLDPFLFLVYQLRKWTLDDSKLIIGIGYGFGDEHINGILRQALRNNPERKLLAITPLREGQTAKEKEAGIAGILQMDTHGAQIICWDMKAKDFMDANLKIERLVTLFPASIELIPEVSETPTEPS